MHFEKRKVSELKFYPGNPRKIAPEMFKRLKRSITEFGLVEPLVINKNNEVIGGNQRLSALKELGIDEVDVIIVDLPKSKEKALNLALNKITGEWDFGLLTDFIEDLDIEDIELTGFQDWEIENIEDHGSIGSKIYMHGDGYYFDREKQEDIYPIKLGYRLEAVAHCRERNLCLDLYSGIGQLAFWYKRLFKKVIRVDKENYDGLDYVKTAEDFLMSDFKKYRNEFDFVDFDDEGCPGEAIQLFFSQLKDRTKDFILCFTDGLGFALKFNNVINLNKYYMYDYNAKTTRIFFENWEGLIKHLFDKLSDIYGWDYKILSLERKKKKEILYGCLKFEKRR